jgi:hypothetical protein
VEKPTEKARGVVQRKATKPDFIKKIKKSKYQIENEHSNKTKNNLRAF